MFGLNKKEEPVISFVSNLTGLSEIKEAIPRKSSAFIPDWWRSVPREADSVEGSVSTIRKCPSFPDYFSQGFILPAWSDFELNYDKTNDSWNFKQAWSDMLDNSYHWNVHGHEQLLDHVSPSFYGKSPTMIFKGVSPWSIITRPGWSVLQLPLFYHFDTPLVTMPGVIDTDLTHEVNLQLMYFGDNETIKIKRGDPLVQYIPFKRDQSKNLFNVRDATKSDKKKFKKQNTMLYTKFEGSGAYNKAQKERDAN